MSNPHTPSGWEDILDPGEEILWQGRPDTALTLAPIKPLQMAIGLFFTVFALFWTSMAHSMSNGAEPWFFRYVFPNFGLIFVAIGLYQMGGYAIYNSFRRKRSWYTLTNTRAFVATNMPLAGKRLNSWPITADMPITLTQNTPGTVHFATEQRSGRNGSYTIPIGFERIHDAAEVHRLIRDIQKGITA